MGRARHLRGREVRKPDALKQWLGTQVEHLRDHPETLSLFTDGGRVVCRATGTLSFEQRYKLNLVVQDFAGDLNAIFVPLLAWISLEQPDLFDRAPNEPFTFESEFLDSGAQDVSIDLELTELVRVEVVDGAWSITDVPDGPRVDAFPGVETNVTLWHAAAEDVGSSDTVAVGG